MSGMGQTTYMTRLPVAYAGQIADNAPRTIETGLNNESAPIPFGVGLVKDAGDRKYRLPNASGDAIDGVSIFQHSVNTIGMSTLTGKASPGPVGDTTITTWVASTAYRVGDMVNCHGKIYKCDVAGTSDTPTGPTAVTTTNAGITDGTVKWHFDRYASAGTGPGYQPGIPVADIFGLLVDGRVYVIPELDVTQDDAVYCRFALGSVAGSSDQLGAFRNAVDSVAAWAAGHAYYVGDRVSVGGHLYEYTTAGTSDNSSPPVPPSTLTTTADSITDSTAKCKYLGEQATGASNTVVKGARFAATAKAGVPVPIAFNKLLARS